MNLLDPIKEYWGFIMFMIGLVFHALWTYFRVGEHEKRINDLESMNKDSTKMINEVKEQISSIDAKLDILLSNYKK